MQTFISFIHEDACVAQPLAAFLRMNGYRVLLTADEWMLYAGEVWLDRIRRELGGAEIVLVLFSRRSVTRPWIHFEAGAAWMSDKLIIPICIGALRVEDLPMHYNAIQAVTLTDYGSVYYLLRSIHRYRQPEGTMVPTTMVPPPNPETCSALLRAVGEYSDPASGPG